MTPRRDWTLHLVRGDGLQSHSLDLGRGRVLFAAAAGILLLGALGAVAGLFWASRSESELVSDLREEIAGLEAERARVDELAAVIAEVEERYGTLQAAVTQGRPAAPPPASIAVGQQAPLARPEPEVTTLAWPLAQPGFVTRTFGSRAEASHEGHTGLDIAVPTGSYVRAVRRGRVEAAGRDSVYGRFVRIAHADGLTSLYGHNSWLFVSTGDVVERLQVIALSGNTGRSTAPHLHLELAQDGSLLDPLTLVTEDGLPGGSAVRADLGQR